MGQIDATANRDLATTFQITGFPTIKLFKDGTSQEYEGGRTAE